MPLRFVHPVQRATHQIALYLNKLRKQDLTQGEAHILALLAESSPATIADLHRGLAHKRSTLTSILDRLAQRKLITRAPSESDRRTFIVALTRPGRGLAQRVSRHLSSLERRVQHKVKSGDVEGFIRVLSALESEAAGEPARHSA